MVQIVQGPSGAEVIGTGGTQSLQGVQGWCGYRSYMVQWLNKINFHRSSLDSQSLRHIFELSFAYISLFIQTFLVLLYRFVEYIWKISFLKKHFMLLSFWKYGQKIRIKAYSHWAITGAGAASLGMGHRPIWFIAASDAAPTLAWSEWHSWNSIQLICKRQRSRSMWIGLKSENLWKIWKFTHTV